MIEIQKCGTIHESFCLVISGGIRALQIQSRKTRADLCRTGFREISWTGILPGSLFVTNGDFFFRLFVSFVVQNFAFSKRAMITWLKSPPSPKHPTHPSTPPPTPTHSPFSTISSHFQPSIPFYCVRGSIVIFSVRRQQVSHSER